MARLVISNGPDKGREYTLDDSQTVGRLADNAITIVDTYSESFGTEVIPRKTTLASDTRGQSKDGLEPHPQLVKLHKIIGMLLWYTRCCRADLAFAISLLSSRQTCWE